MENVNRKRDLSHITLEQQDAIGKKLAAKLSEILDKNAENAKKEANLLLNQYGIEISVEIGYNLKEKS